MVIINGHTISIEKNKLIIDGNVINVKLKESLFNSVSVNNDTIMINKNKIIIQADGIIINGKKYDYSRTEQKEESENTLNKNLNKNAKKYLISIDKNDQRCIDGVDCHRIIAMEDIKDQKER